MKNSTEKQAFEFVESRLDYAMRRLEDGKSPLSAEYKRREAAAEKAVQECCKKMSCKEIFNTIDDIGTMFSYVSLTQQKEAYIQGAVDAIRLHKTISSWFLSKDEDESQNEE